MKHGLESDSEIRFPSLGETNEETKKLDASPKVFEDGGTVRGGYFLLSTGSSRPIFYAWRVPSLHFLQGYRGPSFEYQWASLDTHELIFLRVTATRSFRPAG